MAKLNELLKTYTPKKKAISKRLREFGEIWKNFSEDALFAELCFCLLTPQSKAKSCWAAIENLLSDGALFKSPASAIARRLQRRVRFHNNKSKYIVAARSIFSEKGVFAVRKLLNGIKDAEAKRDWLVKNVKGLGFKEASHFLRNVGLGEDITILDRHILRNLLKFGVIRKLPDSITRKHYMQIEKKMKDFSAEAGMPVSHLDILFWSNETGEIFK